MKGKPCLAVSKKLPLMQCCHMFKLFIRVIIDRNIIIYFDIVVEKSPNSFLSLKHSCIFNGECKELHRAI